MNGLIHSHPVSVVLEARHGAWLDDVRAEAERLADRVGCDVVFLLNGRAHVVSPAAAVDDLALELSVSAIADAWEGRQ